MTARKIYERIAFDGIEMSEQKFCEYLTEAVRHTVSLYGEKYTIGNDGNVNDVTCFTDSIDLYDEYEPCLGDYIKYLLGNEKSFEAYILKSNNAFKNIWSKMSKGKAVRPHLRGEYY
jgi:hypothetical protein